MENKIKFPKLIYIVRVLIPQAFTLILNSSKNEFVLSSILLFCVGIIPICISLIGRSVINSLANLNNFSLHISTLLILETILVIILVTFTLCGNYLKMIIQDKLQNDLRIRIAKNASSLDLEFFEDIESFDTFSKAKRDVGYRPFMIINSITVFIQFTTSVIGFVLVVATFNPFIAFLLIFSAFPSLIFVKKNGTDIYNNYDSSVLENRKSFYYENILTSSNFAKEVRLFNLSNFFLVGMKFNIDNSSHRQWNSKKEKLRRQIFSEILSILVQYAILFYIIYLVISKKSTLGDFILVSAALIGVRQGLLQIINSISDLYENAIFFQDLANFLEKTSKITIRDAKQSESVVNDYSIVFKDVTFAYPGSSENIFKDFNLTIRSGETTALVGANGSGKSTLIKLITRLYDPDEGEIMLGGKNINEIDPHKHRTRIGVMFQDYGMYHLSIKENIALGISLDDIEQEKINKSIYISESQEFINKLPRNLETLLGRQFYEDGKDLSIGQWQKVALSRVLYRDAPIIILDEPSSSMDAKSEKLLFQKYFQISRNKTTILVTHRFNTVTMVDRIIVLFEGKIVEDGNHNELLRLGGHYSEMFLSQAENYLPGNYSEFEP